MGETADILEEILRKQDQIESMRKRIVAKKEENPDNNPSKWKSLKLTYMQLFIEHNLTGGLGYSDSFYWSAGNSPTKYEQLKIELRVKELEHNWSKVDSRQIPRVDCMSYL